MSHDGDRVCRLGFETVVFFLVLADYNRCLQHYLDVQGLCSTLIHLFLSVCLDLTVHQVFAVLNYGVFEVGEVEKCSCRTGFREGFESGMRYLVC